MQSLAAGIVAGVLVALAMTGNDWRLNPGGVFHDAEGTDWRIVGETALSWFLPVAALVAGSVIIGFFVTSLMRR